MDPQNQKERRQKQEGERIFARFIDHALSSASFDDTQLQEIKHALIETYDIVWIRDTPFTGIVDRVLRMNETQAAGLTTLGLDASEAQHVMTQLREARHGGEGEAFLLEYEEAMRREDWESQEGRVIPFSRDGGFGSKK